MDPASDSSKLNSLAKSLSSTNLVENNDAERLVIGLVGAAQLVYGYPIDFVLRTLVQPTVASHMLLRLSLIKCTRLLNGPVLKEEALLNVRL